MIKNFRLYNEALDFNDYGRSFVEDSLVKVEDEIGSKPSLWIGFTDGLNTYYNLEGNSDEDLYRFYDVTFNLESISMVDEEDWDDEDEDEDEDDEDNEESYQSQVKYTDYINFIKEIEQFKSRLEKHNFTFMKNIVLSSTNDMTSLRVSFYYNDKYIINDKCKDANTSFKKFFRSFRMITDHITSNKFKNGYNNNIYLNSVSIYDGEKITLFYTFDVMNKIDISDPAFKKIYDAVLSNAKKLLKNIDIEEYYDGTRSVNLSNKALVDEREGKRYRQDTMTVASFRFPDNFTELYGTHFF